MEKKRAEQAAARMILKAINGLKQVDAEDFEEAKGDLEEVLEAQLPRTGAIQQELREDAERCIREVEEKLRKAKKGRR